MDAVNSTYIFHRFTADELHPLLVTLSNVAMRFYGNQSAASASKFSESIVSALDMVAKDPHHSKLALIAKVLSRDIANKVSCEPVQMFQKIFYRAVQRIRLGALRQSTSNLGLQIAHLTKKLNGSDNPNITAQLVQS
jgi:uncharacterized protein YaaN involved in tellurite resistance